ncbi:MAG: helix-turn-helix transcriptional regulator [Phycisphaerae bacterium]|nr:helix-turn-helix transcriptional regulator [Phycisphaerae bacterium]
MSKILQQIRDAIETGGKTRYRISKETGIDQGQLSKLMAGLSGVSYEALERLAECLDLEIIIRPKRKKGK